MTLSGKENVIISEKYQVLSQETAIIGIIKQKTKSTGELVELNIEFSKQMIFPNEE